MKNNFIENIVYGIHPVEELIKANKRHIFKLYIQKTSSKNILNILKKIDKNKTEVIFASKEQLGSICKNTEHQGIVAIVETRKYKSKMFTPKESSALIILDRIQDPRNLGAILRSAYCLNYNSIVLVSKESASLNSTAIKASAGLSEHLNIHIALSTGSAINLAKENGYNIYLAGFNGILINKFIPKLPFCIVIGNEGEGIQKNLFSQGEIISIPQQSNDISFNASVASAVIMYDFAIKTNIL